MSVALKVDTDFSESVCSTCGIVYYVPHNWQRRRREDHETFYCPNGHTQYYPGKSGVEKLREELAAEQNRKIEALRRANEAEASLRRANEAKTKLKNTLKRQKKRVANGVCPCCNRTFVALGRHMKTKHPEYTCTSN
jgi:hypothetical protein